MHILVKNCFKKKKRKKKKGEKEKRNIAQTRIINKTMRQNKNPLPTISECFS